MAQREASISAHLAQRVAERVHLGGIRFARHDHYLRTSEQGLRQARHAVRDDRVPIALEIEELRCVAVVQVVVRFVEQDAMWKSGSPPEDVQRRQYRSDVLELFIVRKAGQVDDHAAVRIPERAQQLARRWRGSSRPSTVMPGKPSSEL